MKQLLTGLLLGLLVAFSGTSYSQSAPGYQGKRFFAGYQLYLSPALSAPDGRDRQGVLGQNRQHHFRFNYVGTRRTSVALQIGTFKTHVPYTGSRMVVQNEAVTQEHNIPLRGYQIGIFQSLYTKPGIAPFGNSFTFGLSSILYRLNPYSGTFNNLSVGTASTNDIVLNEFYGDLLFSIGYGKQRIINDKILINYGFENGYTFGLLKLIMKEAYGTGSSGRSPSSYFPRISEERLLLLNLINFRIGISLLTGKPKQVN